MRKIILLFIGLLCLTLANNSFSRGLWADEGSPVGTEDSFDFGFSYASNPNDRAKWKQGYTFGYTRQIYNASNILLFQLRFDISYYEFDVTSSFTGTTIEPVIPLWFGLRLTLPVTTYFIFFGDIGVEGTIAEDTTIGRDSFFAFSPGAGIEYHIPIGSPNPILAEVGEMSTKHVTRLIIGFNFRFHGTSNSYITLSPYLGLRY